MAEQKIVSRNFLLCMGMNFCATINFFVLIVSVAGFALTTFHVTKGEAGLAVGIYVIGSLTGRSLFGKYIELVGRKRMLLITVSLALIVSFLYSYVFSFTELCIIRFAHGMAYGVAYSCITSILSKALPPQRRGEGMGYYHLSSTLAMCIGPMLGLYFSGKENFDFVFTVGVLLYTIVLMLAVLIKADEEILTEEQIKMAKSFTFGNMLEISALPLALSAMLALISYSVVNSFISPYSAEIGLKEQALYFFIAVAAGSLVTRITGKFYDVKGANILILPAFASLIIGMMLFATMTTAVQLYIAGFMIGFGYSMIFSIGMTAVLSRVEAHRYGVTSATYSSMVDIGNGCGPMFLGFLIPIIGYGGMYFTAAAIAVIALIFYWCVFGKKLGRIPGREQQKVH